MDPDVLLAEIRNLIQCHRDNPLGMVDADRLIDKVEALDGWIARGGFLPMQWTDVQEEE